MLRRKKTKNVKKKGTRALGGNEGTLAAGGRGRVSAKRSGEESYVVTSVRMRPAHWRALHEEALQVAGPGKRADASAVLRDILDGWLAKRR